MPQVAVSSTDTRIGDRHSRVTYYEEQDVEALFVADAELAQLYQERQVCVDPDVLIVLIDYLGTSAERRVFM